MASQKTITVKLWKITTQISKTSISYQFGNQFGQFSPFVFSYVLRLHMIMWNLIWLNIIWIMTWTAKFQIYIPVICYGIIFNSTCDSDMAQFLPK